MGNRGYKMTEELYDRIIEDFLTNHNNSADEIALRVGTTAGRVNSATTKYFKLKAKK